MTQVSDVEATLARIGAQGMRRTRTCRAVLGVLSAESGLSARQIHERLAGTADLSTVHRVLQRLTEAGETQALQTTVAVTYRLAGPVGHCLVCQDCGRTTAIPDDLAGLLMNGMAGAGFTIGAVVVPARCHECLPSLSYP